MAALVELPGLALRISSALKEEGIPHAVSGAVAMAAHGYVRATQDLDILVIASAVKLPRVFEIVRAQGFEGEDRDLITAIRERFVAALQSGPLTVEILVPLRPTTGRSSSVPCLQNCPAEPSRWSPSRTSSC